MIEAAKAGTATNATALEGFDDFLDVSVVDDGRDRHLQDSDKPAVTDWTPEEAAKALGKSVRTIRRLLQEGTLEGYKVPGPKRLEWRVKPVTAVMTNAVADRTNRPQSDNELVAELRNQIQDLKSSLEQCTKQLEGATYRTGYLEAQVKAYEEQIKLLTNREQRSPWWHRIGSWFAGQ